MKIHRRTFLKQSARAVSAVAIGGLVPPLLRSKPALGLASLERSVYAMGTIVRITAFGADRRQLILATSRAFDELSRMDALLSVFRSSSEISVLNRSAGRAPVHVSSATADVLQAAASFSALTNGRFDATVEPLMELWGFRDKDRVGGWPTDRQLAEALDGVGWKQVNVSKDGWAELSHPRTKVDLGGIGVGFTVDRMGEILRGEGVASALIDHSGDLLAIGAPPDEEGWPVAVPDPLNPEDHVVHVSLKDRAISTSSNGRTIRSHQSGVVGHILDPLTGRNPEGVLSVSMVAPTSTEADALSTALFVQGPRSDAWRNGHREAIVMTGDRTTREVRRIH